MPPQKVNYNQLMKKEIEEISQQFPNKKPTLLLHSCCGPCSTGCLERLIPHFETTLFFYNPNIDPSEEFEQRLKAQLDVLKKIPQFKEVKLVVPEHDYNEARKNFIKAIDLENFPERKTEKECGSRCVECYRFRLEKTFSYASEHGFDFWSTTLTLGPQKDAQIINAVAEQVESRLSGNNSAEKKTRLLHADFKKDGGYLRSIQLCKEYGIYRQHYCGCVFGREASSASEPAVQPATR